MAALSFESLAKLRPEIAKPGYDRSRLRAGIAHIGVGNFHRTHQAVYVERCLHRPGQEAWGIVGIGLGDGPAARAKAEAFRRQDGLYTVTEFSPNGHAVTRVIGAMIDYLHAPTDPEAVIARLASPELKIVTLTVTEGGYNIDEASGAFVIDAPDVAHDLSGKPPKTAFGFIVEALVRRRKDGIPPFTVVSCDNLRHNGDTARRAIAGFAAGRNASLGDWINREVAFPNSMVDRIAPKVSDEDRSRINKMNGIEDELPAVSESYIQWVMEDRFPLGRPALESVGVELRDDVALYETVKGRLLNASHMLMSYPSLLCGHRLVHEAMRDRRIVGLLDAFMERDAIPLLDGPSGLMLQDYKNMVLERFSNPAVGDQLLRIANDGAAKIPVFHSKTLSTLLERGGDIRREAFFLACFARYFRGQDDAGDIFEVYEPSLTRDDIAELGAPDGLGLLRISPFKALALDQSPGFVAAYRSAAEAIARVGAGATLEQLLRL
jgi:mannitol 2-dehydrogenase